MTKRTKTEPTTETVVDAPATAVEQANLPAVVLTADDYINQAVTELKAISADDAIAKLRDQYLPLKVAGLDDRPAYIAAKDGAKLVKDLRLAVENKRKDLKEFPLRYGRAVDAEAKRITELLTPLEAHLKTQVDAFEKAEQVAAEKEFQERHKQLTAAGWGIMGGLYVAGPIQITAEQVRKLTAAQLAKAIQHGQDEQARQEAEKARLEADQRRQREEAKRLAVEQETLRKEQAALIQQRYETRAEWLIAKGFNLTGDGTMYVHGDYPSINISVGLVRNQATPDWQRMSKDLLAHVVAEQTAAAFIAPEPPTAQTFPDVTTQPVPDVTAPATADTMAAMDDELDQPFDMSGGPWSNSHSSEYLDGYDHCKTQVIALFNDGIQRRRSEFIQAIQSLKP